MRRSPVLLASVLGPLLALAACGGGTTGDSGGSGTERSRGEPAPTVRIEPPPAPADGAGAQEGSEAGSTDRRPATVHGAVRFEGEAPARQPLSITTKGCDHGDVAPMTENVLVTDGRLANCIVYVSKGLADFDRPPPAEPARLEQLGCVYRPHVIAMRVGQELRVHNADPTAHNVHVYAKRTNVPNRTQAAGGQDLEIVFEKPEMPVQVGCDIHPWMRAYVGVFDHPHYAVTGTDGAFRIEGVPPGKYTFTCWHEEYGKRTVELELPAGGSAELGFTYRGK